jgi:signal transduction histidine kinase/PAS domain-containing protein
VVPDPTLRGREVLLDGDTLGLLFEQAGLGVCLVGADGRVLRVNAEWLRGTGLPPSLEGGRLDEVAPDADDPVREACARARAGARVDLPRRRVLVDGRETFWDGSAVPVSTADGPGVLVTMHRAQAEEAPDGEEAPALRRSRVLLAAVLENAPTAIAVFGSHDRRVRFANRASQALLDTFDADAPGGSLVGRLLREVVRDPGPLEELIQLVAVSGAPLTDDEYELVLARGRTFWRWSLHPLPAPGGEPDVLLIATEITEQVRARRDAEDSARRAEAAEATAREAAYRIARLQRVTASMSAALTRDDLGRALAGAAVPVTGAAVATVWARDRDADALTLAASTAVPERDGHGGFLALDDVAPASHTARTREPLFLADAAEVEARFPAVAARRRALGHAALAAVPLAVAGRALGVLVLEWRERRGFPPAERELLEAVGAQCGLALERARLHEETGSARARAERLGEALAWLNAGATETEVLHAAAEAATRTLGGFDAAFLGAPTSGAELVGIHETRPAGRNGTRFVLAELPHVAAAIAAARPTLFTRADGRGVERRWLEALGARATLAIPIVRGGSREGVLLVNYADGSPLPGPDVLALAAEVSIQCSIALERARLLEGERRARERLERIERVTSALSAAVSFADIGRAIFVEGLAPLGATQVNLVRRVGDELEFVFEHGLPPGEVAEHARLPLSAPLPACVAVHTRRSVWLESAEEIDRSYPALASLRARLGECAWVSIPLLFRGEAVGVLGVGYTESRRFDADERAFVTALADPCALAMERTRLFEAERAARHAAETASAEARRTTELQQQLMAVVGHDLRTPLQAIAMGVRVVSQRGHLGEQDAATLARVASSAARAAGIISDLLDFGRTRQGLGLRTAPGPVDLAALARRVAAELVQAQPGRALRVVAPDPVEGSWDAERLAQVIQNLAANALVHGGGGAHVEVRVAAEGPDALLAVWNDGPPIAEEDAARLFEPFAGRPPAAGTPVEGGAGLGLFIVREIVRAHGGAVAVRSSELAGTSFEVRLPRRRPAADGSAQAGAPPSR